MSRTERAREGSDFEYFFHLLLAGEALMKLSVIGMLGAITHEKEGHRYRLEHSLVRADGLGEWTRALDDILTGPSSQFLLTQAREDQSQLTRKCREDEWQHDAVKGLIECILIFEKEFDGVKVKESGRSWFRLFPILRNRTRAHGAFGPEAASKAAPLLLRSIQSLYANFNLFDRAWVYLHQNLSGKYRISRISSEKSTAAEAAVKPHSRFPDGIYVDFDGFRPLPLIGTGPELIDFYFANGAFKANRYEMLSYSTDDKMEGDSSIYLNPPSNLPPSETEGHGELRVVGNCFTNAPTLYSEYIRRPKLEAELQELLLSDKRPIITLVGRGGIGKTSLAQKVIEEIYPLKRFDGVVWLSARDVDLQLSGPKVVKPDVISPDDMGKLYASLVLEPSQITVKGFDPRGFMESQLQKSNLGSCLFVFDNFETTDNPVEIFKWIDTFIKLPNQALITTRFREFKGDYPLEVFGMEEPEARELIEKTSSSLGINGLLNTSYIEELLQRSEGHPYVIKLLLGEVAKERKAGKIEKLVAGTEDVLLALFERTYSVLSPCARRAFLTLAAWNSAIPRIALEAVLFRSTEERYEVENGIRMLLDYSLAELQVAPADEEEFVVLPLAASAFGRKKLRVSPTKASIMSDVEILQMLGPSRRDDINLGLAKKIESFISNLSIRVEQGASFEDYRPILEAICRAYNYGWLVLARWHVEREEFVLAREELSRFLENSPEEHAGDAWRLLAQACYRIGDELGEIHAYIERAKTAHVKFYELSNTANKLNKYFRQQGNQLDAAEKRGLATGLLEILTSRRDEALADDFSRMAWLAINVGNETLARDFVDEGLRIDYDHHHLNRIFVTLER